MDIYEVGRYSLWRNDMSFSGKIYRFFINRIREREWMGLINSGLKIGENCNIQPGVFLDPPHCWLIEIGNDVTLAGETVRKLKGWKIFSH